jgi:hypothetical protein
VTDIIAASSRRSKGSPIRSLLTVIALSTTTCDGLRRPFRGVGSTGGRINSVSTSVPDGKKW